MTTRALQTENENGLRFVPNVDICETPEAVWIWADLPGVSEESVEVHLDGGELSIEGRVSSTDDSELTAMHTEYRTGSFHRRFHISQEVDSERVRARMNQGVLEMELPKAQAVRPRRVEIEEG
jgi:HSP20 family molecular chaperone IbpA